MRTIRAQAAAGGLFGALLLLASAHAVAEPQVRQYAVNWFFPALHSVEGDCPGGINPTGPQRFERILKAMNTPPAKIQKLLQGYPRSFTEEYVNRGQIDGHPVNVYINPTSAPDPDVKTSTGKYGYGFNLDGKEGPGDFIDLETGERGVDNMSARAQGCFTTLRGDLNKTMPQHYSAHWETVRGRMPAWLIEITGIDSLEKDDDVTVRTYSAIEPGVRDMSAQLMPDMTFRTSPDPRYMNSLHGRIRHGILTTDPAESFHMLADPYFQMSITLRSVRLRLHLDNEQDRRLKGVIGGYTPFLDVYNSISILGSSGEVDLGVDLPGFYFALRKLADANPDPRTGMNMDISSAYYIEAVPAFLIHREQEMQFTQNTTGHGDKK